MYLLLVWAVTAPEELPVRVREILAAGEVTASVVSYWELVLKKGRQTPPVLQPAAWWNTYISLDPRSGYCRCGSPTSTGSTALPEFHKDPFDRMLVAPALTEECALLSRDSGLARYGVPVVWQ